ncbi:9848_t:CDS:2, partial [Gigaspora rosea]
DNDYFIMLASTSQNEHSIVEVKDEEKPEIKEYENEPKVKYEKYFAVNDNDDEIEVEEEVKERC